MFRISYTSPASHTKMIDETFNDLPSALVYIRQVYGCGLREKYYDIQEYKGWFRWVRVPLAYLSAQKIIGKFIPDEYDGYYEWTI